MFCAQPVLAAQLTNDLPERWSDLDLEAEDGAWAGRLGSGGHYRPHGCLASTRVAILIPYRERESHLATFLKYMHPFLMRQNIEYAILVVNQTDNAPFMRGLLFNAGFLSAKYVLPFTPDCFILHDVDNIPERQGLFYRCSQHGVFHMAAAVDRFQYQLFMPEYTGGVAAVTSDQFSALNGFSNLYLGWGCEDEDFYIRIVDRGLTLARVDHEISRYRTLPHVPNYPNWFWDQSISKLDRERFPNLQQIVDKDGSNTDRFDYNKFLQEGAGYRINSDGLNHAKELYRLDSVTKHHAFTSIQIKTDVKQIHKIGMKYIEKLESFMKAMEGEGNQL